MSEIPILVNRKGTKGNDLAFKILPLNEKVKFSHRRQKTYDSTEKPNFEERKHDTLDQSEMKGSQRYRRVSSSGGTNKFPRDFFKDNLSNTPIRIRFSRSKKETNGIENENFIKQEFVQTKSNSCKKQKTFYELSSPQISCQHVNQVQTPKFNNKNGKQDQLFQHKSKTTNKKVKIQDYLHLRKQNFPCFFKKGPLEGYRQNNQVKYNENETPCLQNKPNQFNEVLLQTLGKKCNEMKSAVNQVKTENLKRKLSNMEKQNCYERALINIKDKKSIKTFLSTKGFNGKLVQKTNSIKFKNKQKQDDQCLNNDGPKDFISLRHRRIGRPNQEDLQANTFRIRKYG